MTRFRTPTSTTMKRQYIAKLHCYLNIVVSHTQTPSRRYNSVALPVNTFARHSTTAPLLPHQASLAPTCTQYLSSPSKFVGVITCARRMRHAKAAAVAAASATAPTKATTTTATTFESDSSYGDVDIISFSDKEEDDEDLYIDTLDTPGELQAQTPKISPPPTMTHLLKPPIQHWSG